MLGSAAIDSLWDFSDPAASLERFQQAEKDHPESAGEIRTQAARALGLLRRFEEAEALLASVPDEPPALQARKLLERGRLLNSSGSAAAAQPVFRQALEAAKASGADFYAVDAAHMLGIAHSGDESLKWNEEAIQMARRSTDSRAQGWKGSLLNNTAWTLHDMGEHTRALALFEEALAFRQEQGKPEPLRIARWSVARCLRSLGRLDEALAIQRELAEGPEDGYVSEELAELLLALNRPGEAAAHFAKAHALLSQDEWLAENETERLARLKELGAAVKADRGQAAHAFDLDRFWQENEQSKGKPFSTLKPRAPIAIPLDDHWLLEELALPSTVRYYKDEVYRLECNAEANRRCRSAIGIAPFAEQPGGPAPRRIEELFGARTEVIEGGTPWLEPGISSPEELARLLDELEGISDEALAERMQLPDHAAAGGIHQAWSRGPATIATSVLGTTEAMYAVVDEPDLMERFFRVLADILVRWHGLWAKAQGKRVAGVGILDDNCALFSPQLYGRFCLPVWERLAAEFSPGESDMRYQHSDSSMEHLLPLLAKLQLTGCNFGPTLSVQTIRRLMPATEIQGQIAPFTLRNGSAADVEAEVIRDWEGAGADGGLLITTAGSVAAGTSLESIRAWMECVDRICRY